MIHCKNLECFYKISELDVNFFWHEKDKVVITSKGFFGIILVLFYQKSICVMPEINNIKKLIVWVFVQIIFKITMIDTIIFDLDGVFELKKHSLYRSK